MMKWLMPSFWIMIHTYSSGLDRAINSLLDEGVVPQRLDKWHAKLGHLTLWVANYPYGYAEHLGKRPSRKTIYRFSQALDAEDFRPATAATLEKQA